MTRSQLLRAAALVVLAAGGLALLSSMGSLQWPTVLAYSRLAATLCGALSIFLPPRWLGFSRRFHGLAAGVCAGAALFAAGWFWPVRSFTTPSPASRLDAFMPTCDFHERHEITIQAPPERVREALNLVSLADIGVMQTLGKIRAAAMGRAGTQARTQGAPALTLVEMIRNPHGGFFPLDDTPRELVFGMAGRPWNNAAVRLAPGEFRDWAPPGNVKIAANFRIENAGGGRSRVVTETRVAVTDQAARRKMGRYWALIYPGSGMVRRSLLNVIRARAERP